MNVDKQIKKKMSTSFTRSVESITKYLGYISIFTRQTHIIIIGTLIYYFIYIYPFVVGDMCDDVFQIF